MFISNVSKEQWANFCQITANVCTVTSGVTTVAFAILGRDYTYPATVTVLGAFTSVTIWLAKTPNQENVNKKSENKTEGSKESVNSTVKGFEDVLDEVGGIFKQKLHEASDQSVGVSINASTAGAKLTLGNSFGSLSEVVLNPVGESTKGLLNKSTDSSIDKGVKLLNGSLANWTGNKKEN